MTRLGDIERRPTPVDVRDVLYQDKIWVTMDGYVHKISSLGEDHIKRILNYLDRIAPIILADVQDCAVFGPQPRGEMAQALFEQELDWLLDTSPSEYMDEMELTQALRSRLADIEAYRKKLSRAHA